MTAEDSEYEIFFVDYGDSEWVESCSVRSLQPSLLEVW